MWYKIEVMVINSWERFTCEKRHSWRECGDKDKEKLYGFRPHGEKNGDLGLEIGNGNWNGRRGVTGKLSTFSYDFGVQRW